MAGALSETTSCQAIGGVCHLQETTSAKRQRRALSTRDDTSDPNAAFTKSASCRIPKVHYVRSAPTNPKASTSRPRAAVASSAHVVAAMPIAQHQLLLRAPVPAVQADRAGPLRLRLFRQQHRPPRVGAEHPAVVGWPSPAGAAEPLDVLVSQPSHDVEPRLRIIKMGREGQWQRLRAHRFWA